MFFIQLSLVFQIIKKYNIFKEHLFNPNERKLKNMKKLTALFLALAMCLSMAVIATATDYAPYTFNMDGLELHFSAARSAKETLKFYDFDGTYEKEITIIYLKPGSTVDYVYDFPYAPGANYHFINDDGLYEPSPAWHDIHKGAVEKTLYDGMLLELDWENNIFLALDKSSKPSASTAPIDPAKTAYASTQNIGIDYIISVSVDAYALKDANGNDTNYVKLRDIAHLLNGTEAQFNVAWDGNINLVTDSPYTANGTEMSTPFAGNREYSNSTAVTKVNGKVVELEAICLTDDAGGGYTYYKLRDLGKYLGFNVSWSAETGILIETNVPYSEAN